jgi:DNA-binding transcriptional LysR family regulator
MNVRDFEYLVEISKQRSITKAANTLYISQPALSKFVLKLEKEAGVKLFYRIGKQFVPTYAGECCIEKAKMILNIHNQMNQELYDIGRMEKGLIKFGLPMSRTAFFISKVMPNFKNTYPNINIVLTEEKTSDILHKLQTGDLNIILMNYTVKLPNIKYIDIAVEEMVLAVPINHKLNNESEIKADCPFPFIKTEKWESEPFIMLSLEQKTGIYSDQYFRKHEIKPNIALEIKNLGQALKAVENEIGITITPSMPIPSTESERKINYLSIEDSHDSRQKVAIAYRKDSYLSIAEKELIKIIINNYK